MGKDKIKFKEKLAYATVNFGNIPIMCHIVPDCKNPGWIK